MQQAQDPEGRAEMKMVVLLCLLIVVVMASFCAATAEDLPMEAELGKLECVKIVVETLGSEAEGLGLTRDAIRDTTMVALRARTPRLPIIDTCSNTVYVNVNMLEARSGERAMGYFSSVEVHLDRYVMVRDTGGRTVAPVWSSGQLTSGPTHNAESATMLVIEDLLRSFAAEYYKAGNE